MKSFVSLIGFLRNFKWDLSVTFAAAAHHKPKSQRSTVSHTNLPVDTTPNNLLYLSHTPAHASILPPSSSWDGSHLFPSSLFRPHLCKQLVANIIWLRREYIHHASLSFSKVTSLKNMKSCPAVGMYSCAQVLCVRLKAPSKSSLKAQTTFCLFSEAKARGIFCLVHASLCSQLPCPVSEWTNTQHDKTHHSVAIRCPIPPPRSCYTFSFLAVSPWERQPKTCLSHLFSVAAKCCLIGLVNFLHPCFSLLALHGSHFPHTSSSELNSAQSLIGITVHVQWLIHNARLSFLLSFKS